MQVISIYDLNHREALQASLRMRLHSGKKLDNPAEVKEAISLVGGRLSYLSRVSKATDMMAMAQHLLRVEKGWLLSQIGLIEDCDDDVMDEVGLLLSLKLGTNLIVSDSKNGALVRGYSFESLSRCGESKKRTSKRRYPVVYWIQILSRITHCRPFLMYGIPLRAKKKQRNLPRLCSTSAVR